MTQKILIIGGQGRIGSSVAQDLATHVDADIIVTGCQKKQNLGTPRQFLALDLADLEALKKAIFDCDLVIHCAGPFHYRDGRVLKTCIETEVNYIDVSDHRCFYHQVVPYQKAAREAGITAILHTGVFPGISNSMARQGVEQLDEAETINLSYVVAGSGGAGLTVMHTTFLGLRQPFNAWIDSKWQEVLPYSDRAEVQFPPPYGKTNVYWFDVAETYSLAQSFPVKNVMTKFGSVPDIYNQLTWLTARFLPPSWLEDSQTIEFLAQVSYGMTLLTDKWSGIGISIRADITGKKNGKPVKYWATMVHKNTAVAAGCGTGSIAQLTLEGKLTQPGIWPVEQVLPTNLFADAMKSRGIEIQQNLSN